MLVLMAGVIVLIVIITYAVYILVDGSYPGTKVYVNLFCISRGKDFKILLRRDCIIGSDMEQCDYIIVGDNTVDKKHCIITSRKKKLYLINESHKNITCVNGQKCNKTTRLYENDVIHLGAYEYRITW